MRFLVTGENIDPGYLMPPDQYFQALQQAVVPSFQMLAHAEQQGKVHGGLVAGERAGAFIIDVDSPEELDSFMNHLPFFGVCKWNVKALVTFDTIAQQLPGYLSDAQQMMQQGGGQ